MTIAQMHISVNLGFQRIGSHIFDDFQTEEIDTYLNNAITKYVKARLDSYEKDQKAAEDLKTLIVTNHIVADVTGAVGSSLGTFTADEADFPDNYFYLLSSRSQVKYNKDGVDLTGVLSGTKRTPVNTVTTKVVLNKLVQKDDIYRLLLDPFNRTNHKCPLSVLTDTGLRIYTDSKFTVTEVYLDYIKTPATVVVDTGTPEDSVSSDLPEHTHQEIVDLCVSLMREDSPPS